MATRWRGLLLHAHPVRPVGAEWSRVPVEHGHAFELSGTAALPADPGALARTILHADGAELLEMADPARGAWRWAALRDGRLLACLYLTDRATALPSSRALAAMLAGPVADAARRTVLAGGGTVAPAETLVCACFSVGLETLRGAVASQRLTTVAEIGAALRAGTNCGSCIPELREILRDQLAPA